MKNYLEAIDFGTALIVAETYKDVWIDLSVNANGRMIKLSLIPDEAFDLGRALIDCEFKYSIELIGGKVTLEKYNDKYELTFINVKNESTVFFVTEQEVGQIGLIITECRSVARYNEYEIEQAKKELNRRK